MAKPNKAAILFSRVIRGGLRSVPLIGAVLEEATYGVMEEVAARAQSQLVTTHLRNIQATLDQHTRLLADILTTTRETLSLSVQMGEKLDILAAAVRPNATDGQRLEVYTWVTRLVERDESRADDLLGPKPWVSNPRHQLNPNFVGRETYVADLREALASSKPAALTQAIHGMGGVGKTQLAARYCQDHRAEYDVVWWLRAEQPESLAGDYAALATELGLPEADAPNQAAAIEAVRDWLQGNDGWLLVFDNAPKQDSVRPYFPTGVPRGHVIITSRDPIWVAVATPLKVGVFERVQSVEFLLKRAGRGDAERSAAEALAEELGDLPLALEHAGAYAEQTGCSFKHYLELFRQQPRDMLRGAKAPVDYHQTVATTWNVSFAAVEEASPASADLLRLVAFLAPDDIPLDVIAAHADALPKRLRAAARKPKAWTETAGVLHRYSLADVSGNSAAVHRLVQAVVRDRMGDAVRKTWAGAAVTLMRQAFPYEEYVVETWGPCARLLPHALTAARHADEAKVELATAAFMFNQVGSYLETRAVYADARQAFERAVELGEAAYGPDAVEVATYVNNLGYVLGNQGDLEGAKKYYGRALAIDEAARGPDHPKVAIRLNNLGGVLRTRGDLEGARKHYERALAIDEAAFGPYHPKVAIRLNNFGSVLRDQGDLDGAKRHFERALAIDEAAYGADHPEVAIRLNNLGSLLRDQGDLDGATKHLERALAIDEAAFGPDPPKVAIRLNNLGIVLRARGDLEGARKHFERALAILQRVYGEDHAHTAKVRRNLEALAS